MHATRVDGGGEFDDLREYGKPVTHFTQIATTMIDGVTWELYSRE